MSEILYANELSDFTYGTLWTPNSTGHFSITITIDGISLEDVYRLEVKETGIPPPQKPVARKSQPQNKLRKFVAKNSAGLRIRTLPTLQSEQISLVKPGGVISLVDEVRLFGNMLKSNSYQVLRKHTFINPNTVLLKMIRLKMMMELGYDYRVNQYASIVSQVGIPWKLGAYNLINILIKLFCIRLLNK